MKKTIMASALALISFNSFADTSIPDVKGQMQVTANVAAGCDLTAENINFGVLQMPISTQYASGGIEVNCSKNVLMTFNISYSERATNNNSSYTYNFGEYNSNSTWYIIRENGVALETSSPFEYSLGCSHTYRPEYDNIGGSGPGQVYFFSQAVIDFYGVQANSLAFNKDIWGICSDNLFNEDTFLKAGRVSQSGVLKGIASGEEITYSINNIKEGDTSLNTSNNGYTLTAIGAPQNLTMVAEINQANNPTHRMTPDTYTASLTVSLNY